MTKPKHNAYRPEQVTDGIVTWTRKHFDMTKPFTPADQAEMVKMLMAGAPAARLESLARRIEAVADHPDTTIQMHVASIRESLDALSSLRSGRTATRDEMDRLNQADQQWIKVLILRDAIPLARRGAKFSPGRDKGAGGPVRRAIKALLTKAPGMKNAELWERVKARPPRGWTAYDNRVGRYIEGPTPAQVTSYSRFCNIAAEERKALRGS